MSTADQDTAQSQVEITAEELRKVHAQLLNALRTSEQRAAELSVSNKALSVTLDQLREEFAEREKAEAGLRAAKEAAEKADRAKSVFLASASHDLRQPLHTMRLLLEAYPKDGRDKHELEILTDLRQAVAFMGSILDALLDVSRLEAGMVDPEVQDFAVDDLLDRMYRAQNPQAQEKGLAFRRVHCGAVIRSDPDLLGQIIQNLLSNAIRHTESGRILLGCRRQGRSLRIQVYDTGEGIPEDQHEAIFEEFYQLGSAQRDRYRGLGLGLAIVERLARLLGHGLELRSIVGRGSEFTVEVPLVDAVPVTKGAPVETRVDEEFPGIVDVLVIEDDPAVLKATGRLFDTWGCVAFLARSGEQALHHVSGRSRPPELVIADYHLPDAQTGLKVLHKIRAIAGSRVPGIILSGNIAPGIVREARESGCAVLHKPVRPADLRAAIRDVSCPVGQPDPVTDV